jgi:DNA-binding CsgD family transcriptional regulator
MESMAVLILFYRLYRPATTWRRVAVLIFAPLSSAVWVVSFANFDANRNDLLLLGILVALVLLNGNLRGSLLAAAFYHGICSGVDYFLLDCFMLFGRIPCREDMYGVDMYLHRLILEAASVLWAYAYYRIIRKFQGKLPNVIYGPTVVAIPAITQALIIFSNHAAAQVETPEYFYVFGMVFNALLVIIYTATIAVYIQIRTANEANAFTMKVHNTQPVWTKEAGLSPLFIAKFGITDREREIIGCILEGKSDKDIALALNIAVSTTRTHLKNIYRKTGSEGRFSLLSLLRV